MHTHTLSHIDIGVDQSARRHVVEGLSKFLADTYALYVKTQNFHWNVTGPLFPALHKFFEEQYQELALAVDVLAERIRALGYIAPGTFRDFIRLTSIEEEPDLPDAGGMTRSLMEGHELLSKKARILLTKADDEEDQATVDLLADRIRAHDKAAWMLRSSLAEGEKF
ncbi:MAG: DNA starvation/stationary phase protection protein [Candidatus Omnitrophica bacterium]|nr:DNA starvation/stationary phase protection protein [Candidatus Omnitrophota bacterium]